MNTSDLIKEALADRGYDGLYNPDTECGCTLDDFAPCGEWFGWCVPGVRREPGSVPECGACQSVGPGADFCVCGGAPAPRLVLRVIVEAAAFMDMANKARVAIAEFAAALLPYWRMHSPEAATLHYRRGLRALQEGRL